MISVTLGADCSVLGSHSGPIGLENGTRLYLERHGGTKTFIPFEIGIGAIFLRPLRDGRLELVVWGSDKQGLRQASRLMPMLTGVGQPDFVIVSKRCAWEGAAGVLAMGWFDNHWKVSEASFVNFNQSLG